MPLAACTCKDEWEFNSVTYYGCAITPADPKAWCYTTTECSTSSPSSSNSGQHSSDCTLPTTTTTVTTVTTATTTMTTTTTTTTITTTTTTTPHTHTFTTTAPPTTPAAATPSTTTTLISFEEKLPGRCRDREGNWPNRIWRAHSGDTEESCQASCFALTSCTGVAYTAAGLQCVLYGPALASTDKSEWYFEQGKGELAVTTGNGTTATATTMDIGWNCRIRITSSTNDSAGANVNSSATDKDEVTLSNNSDSETDLDSTSATSSDLLPGSMQPTKKSSAGLIVGLALLSAILAAAAAFFSYRNQWFGLCPNNNTETEAVQQEFEEAEAERNTICMETNPLARQNRSVATTVNPTFNVAGANVEGCSTNGGDSVGTAVYMVSDPKQPDVYDTAKENQNAPANPISTNPLTAASVLYAVPMQAAAASSSSAPVYATYASNATGGNDSNGNRNMDINGYQIDGYYEDASHSGRGTTNVNSNGGISRNMDINGYQIDGYYDDVSGDALNSSAQQGVAQAEQSDATTLTTTVFDGKRGCARGNVSSGGRACRNQAIPNSKYCKGHTCKTTGCFSTKSSADKYCPGHNHAATDC